MFFRVVTRSNVLMCHRVCHGQLSPSVTHDDPSPSQFVLERPNNTLIQEFKIENVTIARLSSSRLRQS